MARLDHKIALVTGTTSGMGREIARRFVAEGATVVGIARRAERHQELVEELGEQYVPFVGDVSKQEDIKAVVAETLQKFEKIDILVNAAGWNDEMYPVGNVSDEILDKAIALNLIAPIKLMREVVPGMVDEMEGSIINISSVGGICGCKAGVGYTAAKHGLIGATKNTAFMYAASGVRCNAICPGPYATECKPLDPDPYGYKRTMAGAAGMPRIGDPEKIANLACFLASDEAEEINGAVITSDSGWSCM
ncbi:MAG: SDR family oxidoreductase [Oscillospiraceae bacterium]